MTRRACAVIAVAALAGISAPAASADPIPNACERQRALFEKYKIELGMVLPEPVVAAYSAACKVTG